MKECDSCIFFSNHCSSTELSEDEKHCPFMFEFDNATTVGGEIIWKEISYNKYTENMLDFVYDEYSSGLWNYN